MLNINIPKPDQKGNKNPTLPFRAFVLISLADMIRFAIKAYDMAEFIVRWQHQGAQQRASDSDNKGAFTKEERLDLFQKLSATAKPTCIVLELNQSVRLIEQIEYALRNEPPEVFYHDIATRLLSLWHTMDAEISEKHFAFIPPEKAKFFEQDRLFGEAVNKAFPSAAPEIKDAGNCLAAELDTAAVFHLMRATEYGLRALARHLKVKVKHPLEYAEWGVIAGGIEKRLTALKAKPRGPKKDADVEFYRICLNECVALKDVWRNRVMHARCRCNHGGALGVFAHVGELMNRLATRVKEVS
jgi:hypothetical protein